MIHLWKPVWQLWMAHSEANLNYDNDWGRQLVLKEGLISSPWHGMLTESSGEYLSETSVPLSRPSCLRCLSRQPCHLGSLPLQERLKHIVTISRRSWCFPTRRISLVTPVFSWNVTKELLTRYPLRLIDTHSLFTSSAVVYLVLTLSSLLDSKI